MIAELKSKWFDLSSKYAKKNNEDNCAIFAKKRLKSLNFERKRLKNVQILIISTKKHQIILDSNKDNPCLLDLNLYIRESDWETYQNNIQQIRKEYKIYPDFMYKSCRKKYVKLF